MTEKLFQPWELTDLSLHQLLLNARNVSAEGLPQIRLAIMGNAATQHYSQALSSMLKLRGFCPKIYEAEFNTILNEALEPKSGLYEHKPEFIIIFTSAQAIWPHFSNSNKKSGFVDQISIELQLIWENIRKNCNAIIIQHNFVVPISRPLGLLSSPLIIDFASSISSLNSHLADHARNYRVLIVDTESMASFYGKKEWLDERLWCYAKQALSPKFLPQLTKSISNLILRERGIIIKCIILDLDNTLWGGILADDGFDGIELGQTELGLAFYRFQIALKELRERGILLAICSKNSEDNVLTVLDEHPDMLLRRDDFSMIVANFDDKVTNIRLIQKTLKISFESMVFFDDSSFERVLLRSAIPELQVPDLPEDPSQFIEKIYGWNIFEGHEATEEDLARATYYQADKARAEIKGKYEGLDEYLANLLMHVQVIPINDYSLPRIHQLVLRTNQFNLTTKRYSENDLRDLSVSLTHSSFCIRLKDRLGDNGIIAVVIIEKQGSDAVIDSWIMSCRVLGRKIEELTLQQIVHTAKQLGCTKVIGIYSPTPKNQLVQDLYSRLGFVEFDRNSTRNMFAIELSKYKPVNLPISITNI